MRRGLLRITSERGCHTRRNDAYSSLLMMPFSLRQLLDRLQGPASLPLLPPPPNGLGARGAGQAPSGWDPIRALADLRVVARDLEAALARVSDQAVAFDAAARRAMVDGRWVPTFGNASRAKRSAAPRRFRDLAL